MRFSAALSYKVYKSLNRDDEYELIRRCIAGQMSAKNRLAQLINPYLERWIRSQDWITPSTPLEDMMQTAWEFFDRMLEKFNFEKGYRFWTYFKGWANKAIIKFRNICLNRKANTKDKDNTEPTLWLSLDVLNEDGSPTIQPSDPADLFDDVSADLMRTRYRSAILEALEPYDEEIQQIFLLRLYEGWKWKQVAEHLDLTESKCVYLHRKAKGEVKANLEYVLQRPLTLAEIEAMEVDTQWQAQIKAATEPVEPQISLAELKEKLTPFFEELLQEKFEQLQQKILAFLSLVTHRDQRKTWTWDREPSISASPIWRWTATLIALVTRLCLWLWPHARTGAVARGQPTRVRGPCSRGHPNFNWQNTSRRFDATASQLVLANFQEIEDVCGLNHPGASARARPVGHKTKTTDTGVGEMGLNPALDHSHTIGCPKPLAGWVPHSR